MKPVIVHAEAEAELRDAIAHYEKQRAGLGGEFRTAVESLVGRIRQRPRSFARYDGQGTREALVRRFPYAVFFVETEAAIWVAAIAHQRRRPGYWADRYPE